MLPLLLILTRQDCEPATWRRRTFSPPESRVRRSVFKASGWSRPSRPASKAVRLNRALAPEGMRIHSRRKQAKKTSPPQPPRVERTLLSVASDVDSDLAVDLRPPRQRT